MWTAFGIPQHMLATEQAVAAMTILCLAPFLAHGLGQGLLSGGPAALVASYVLSCLLSRSL